MSWVLLAVFVFAVAAGVDWHRTVGARRRLRRRINIRRGAA